MLSLIDYHSQLDEALNVNNSDSIFDTLYYTDLINEQRSLGLRNEYNKDREIDPNIEQRIPCEDVILVNGDECCTEIPIGCKILRTKNKIPNTIELHQKKGITSVGPVTLTSKRFTLINYNRVPYIGNGRTTSNAIYAFLYNEYIYFISRNPSLITLKKVLIRGIFEDPTLLAKFTDCSANGAPCWSPSDPYPLNDWMWAYIKPQIIQQLMQKRQIPEDENNNANDDLGDGRTAN